MSIEQYNQPMTLTPDFFSRDTLVVAQQLLGKIIHVKHNRLWLAARIIETEAYYLEDKGSHASLGFTAKRQALFMAPGTIYMYYARGGDSLNISCHGEGNAVLIKSAYPYLEKDTTKKMIRQMQQLNPPANNKPEPRPINKLCSGQTLLCKSLGLKVTQWNQKQFNESAFYIADEENPPKRIIQTTRLGIPQGRDHELPYRFVDFDYATFCSSNPLTIRRWQEGKEYRILSND